jgi:hypothetical protein
MGETALLVLEGPWWTPAHKPKRPSVLPFLEGLEKFKGNFNIYYSNFYEKEGFRKALEDDLVNAPEERLFIYIAAHGGSRMVGALELECGKSITSGMRLTTLLRMVRKVSRTANIEGILLGSCTLGANRADLLGTLKTSPLAWIFGYACEIDWIPSTLIDLSILEHAMALKKEELRSRTKIIGAFSSALSRFSGEYPICKEANRSVPLKYAISLLGKPRRPRAAPEDLTRTLLVTLGWDTL